MSEAIDLQGQDAAWWAMQAQRYKAETAALQRKYDELVQSSAKALQEQSGQDQERHAAELQKQREDQEKAHREILDRLTQQFLQEPASVRELREQHAQEATELAQKQSQQRAELISQMK